MLEGNKGPTLHTQTFSHILSKRAELESQCPLDGLYSRWPDFIFRTQEQHMATMGITPPIAEILCVKNGRAIVVCGFLVK